LNLSSTPLPASSSPRHSPSRGALASVDLDLLRGWSERIDPELRSDHLLPPLARLVALDHPGRALVLHGPRVVIGRYHPQHGPADLVPSWWSEPQLYKLGAPHVQLLLSSRGWRLKVISPTHHTALKGGATPLSLTQEHPIAPGDELTLGKMRLRFELDRQTLTQWEHHTEDILRTAHAPTLFLKRSGGLCGPSFCLVPRTHVTLGRSLPKPLASAEVDWDLSGLFDDERRHLGFRHACLDWTKDGWELSATSARQKVWLNRRELTGSALLSCGDEIGLGNVLLHFYDPKEPSGAPELPLPSIVNWLGEHSSEASQG